MLLSGMANGAGWGWRGGQHTGAHAWWGFLSPQSWQSRPDSDGTVQCWISVCFQLLGPGKEVLPWLGCRRDQPLLFC